MKITYNQYKEILNLKKEHFIQKLMKYEVIFPGNGTCSVRSYIPMWLYIIAFIPMHLLVALFCVWDGGLKEFEIQPRKLIGYSFFAGDGAYERAKKIYEKA